ncbi:DUF3597 domain-containing protein [soil metagenome]
MSIFGDLMNKIRGHSARAQEAKINEANAAQNQTSAPSATAAGAAPATDGAPVDVEAVLTDLASKSSQKLDWRNSIVDLMKLVGMESSLTERKDLAKELGYTGDTSDSAAMNIWLHKQVMKKMSENGGKVPADLLD